MRKRSRLPLDFARLAQATIDPKKINSKSHSKADEEFNYLFKITNLHLCLVHGVSKVLNVKNVDNFKICF
jgi:hypothetical protein